MRERSQRGTPERTAAHEHRHSHGHSHGLGELRLTWGEQPILRLLVPVLALVAVATVVALVVLWPDGRGRATASSGADDAGLTTERYPAEIVRVVEQPCSYARADRPAICRVVTFRPSEGPDAGAEIDLPELNLASGALAPRTATGDAVIVGYEPDTDAYFLADRDRRPVLLWLTAAFAVVVVALGRVRGASALAAMALSVAILVGFVAPAVLDGRDPLLVSIVAAAAIAFVSLFLTHGFTPQTALALAGTLGALALTLAVSALFFRLSRFTGLATEEGLTLPLVAGAIDLPALLLGGAVLGALGALDDVTVTQVAVVAELRDRNPDLTVAQLIASGIRVGREHIASTVNTLLLAYVGAAMPLVLLFALSTQPLVMIANSELLAVEIVRTLCGSIGLVAAVPLTTALAAAVLARPARPDVDGSVAGDGDGDIADPAPQRRARQPRWEDFAPDDTGF